MDETTGDWDTFARAYEDARTDARWQDIAGTIGRAARAFSASPDGAASWFLDALASANRAVFAATVLAKVRDLPDVFFEPLLHAAVAEADPSWNRVFVEPCVTAFGHRRVNEFLLGRIRDGSNTEKAGAVNALYWAQIPVTYVGCAPTPDSLAAHDVLRDVWERERVLFLKEFVSNPDLDVRRSLLPSLCLDPACYPEDVRPLVNEAITIARGHPDEYIRHRVEVQLGGRRTLLPLPRRDDPPRR